MEVACRRVRQHYNDDYDHNDDLDHYDLDHSHYDDCGSCNSMRICEMSTQVCGRHYPRAGRNHFVAARTEYGLCVSSHRHDVRTSLQLLWGG